MAKVYVWNGRMIQGKYWDFLSVSVHKDKIAEAPDNKNYVKLIVSEMKESDKFGNTHTLYYDDDYQSKQSNGNSQNTNDIMDELF